MTDLERKLDRPLLAGDRHSPAPAERPVSVWSSRPVPVGRCPL